MGPSGPTQLRDELLWAESTERCVRPHSVVVLAPVGSEVTHVPEASEAMLVEELVPDATVEALREGVLDRLSRPDEVMLDLVGIAPGVEGSAGELRSIVRSDSSWLTIGLNGLV